MRASFLPTRERSTPGRRCSRGFTMLELIIVVAIFGILLSLAGPSMTRMIAQQRLKSAASDLHLSMAKARAEAIKRNVPVSVNPTGGSWANGWSIPDPQSGTIVCDPQPVIPCLEVRGPTSSVSVSTSVTQVIYRGSGRPVAAASFVFSASGVKRRCLDVSASGRADVKEAATLEAESC